MLESLLSNLSSPLILCFALGLIARLLGSNLKLPEQLYQSISIYLLLAIGIKGGVQISGFAFSEVGFPILFCILLSIVTGLTAQVLSKFVWKYSDIDSVALAAHYGSVSAVTYIVGLGFLDQRGITYPGYSTALFAIMEIPAIILALALFAKQVGGSISEAVRYVMFSKTNMLLIGGIIIGLLSKEEHAKIINPLFQDLFYGLLTFFLLEMGLIVGEKLKENGRPASKLLLYGTLVPLLHGSLTALLCRAIGFDIGLSTIVATLGASASYIAAPAAVQQNLPEANPLLYITSSLAITFPFNISLGIPIYYSIASSL